MHEDYLEEMKYCVNCEAYMVTDLHRQERCAECLSITMHREHTTDETYKPYFKKKEQSHELS